MWKLAWPSLCAQGSVSSEILIDGISQVGCRVWKERPGWNDTVDALEDRGGVGIPLVSGEKVGVPMADVLALGSATVGDWSGDCSSSVELVRCSAINGGNSGVEAKS